MKTKSIATRQTALITGASSGIGYELAKLFARDDHDLVLVSRMAPMLERIARELKRDCGVHVTIIAKDLFRPEAAQELYDEIRAAGITVDYLVNDAGQGAYGRFAETALDQELSIIQPHGLSFEVSDNNLVFWQGCTLCVGFTYHEGLVLQDVRYSGHPKLNRASFVEMAVPYTNPNPPYTCKCTFNVSNYRLGYCANSLKLGCNCLGHIHYFNVHMCNARGNLVMKKKAI